ncbi:MAG: DNA repair protein RecN [Bacteroidota bacterium]
MLSCLSVNNYALIKVLEMEPHRALNIITGETGAGKSIMLGAVGLLLGNRADTKVLYNQDKKCIIEGEFNISAYNLSELFNHYDLDYDEQTVIRREITPNGKSRAFVNDTPVTLDVLKDLGEKLMDIHSQHQTLLIGKADYQLNLIDIYSGSNKLLSKYKKDYNKFITSKNHLLELENNAEKISQESEYNSFLLKELKDLNLAEDEQESLEEELKILEHAEEIKGNLSQVLILLDQTELNANEIIHQAKGLISQISRYSDSLNSIDSRINALQIELTDLIREIESQEQLVDIDNTRTEEVRERISNIYHLQNKHHVSDIKGLLKIQKELEETTYLADHLDEQIEEARNLLEKARKDMLANAIALSENRIKSFGDFENEITSLLQQLGMPDARLKIQRNKKDPFINGIDDITINFTANKGVNPAPLKTVASGGEFSRLMFCFKYVMASKTALPTMVFDEIDAGISGEIALQLGKMMSKMSENHQVITISHLPQIAGKGQSHYFVYKENDEGRSISKVKKLSTKERINEIAKMIGGDVPSEHAINSARELISE